AWEDYVYWQRTDRKILERINTLIKESQRTPFEGMGRPEPLKHGLSGYWSRRINDEHRMVYKVEAGVLFLAQIRYYYCFLHTLMRDPARVCSCPAAARRRLLWQASGLPGHHLPLSAFVGVDVSKTDAKTVGIAASHDANAGHARQDHG